MTQVSPISSHEWHASFSGDDFSRKSSYKWYGTPDDDEAKALRVSAKTDFLANHDVRYPNLEFPLLEALDMDSVEMLYQQLLVDTESIDDTEAADAHYEQAARKLAELYRHKEIMRRLGWTANEALSRERAGDMTLELFGEVETEDFAHLLTNLRAKAGRLADKSQEAKELLSLLGDIAPTTFEPAYEISADAIETLRGDIYELFPGLQDIIEDAPTHADTTIEEKATYMQRIADSVCGGYPVRIVVVAGTQSADTNVEEGTITIGRDKLANYSPKQLVKTGVHESIGHMVRGIRAQDQLDPTMRNPLPGYLAYEEGFATGLEQIITGETRIAGEQYYLSLGFQLGIDQEGKKRDFRDTFEIMWRRLVVEELAAGREITLGEAQNKAYTQVMRTNRGGALDARDISYFNGSKYSYPWINSVARMEKPQRVEALTIALSARFDATNDEQWQKAEEAHRMKEAA